jgi:hypothetical protein
VFWFTPEEANRYRDTLEIIESNHGEEVQPDLRGCAPCRSSVTMTVCTSACSSSGIDRPLRLLGTMRNLDAVGRGHAADLRAGNEL